MYLPSYPLAFLWCGYPADVEYRARKVRVLPSTSSSGTTTGMLARRTYTWRGISSRRAQKQQRQLDAMQAAAQQAQQHQQAEQQPQEREGLPAVSGGSPGSGTCLAAATAASMQQQQPQPSTAAAAAAAASSGSGGSSSASKEGDRDWAALTTWLRM